MKIQLPHARFVLNQFKQLQGKNTVFKQQILNATIHGFKKMQIPNICMLDYFFAVFPSSFPRKHTQKSTTHWDMMNDQTVFIVQMEFLHTQGVQLGHGMGCTATLPSNTAISPKWFCSHSWTYWKSRTIALNFLGLGGAFLACLARTKPNQNFGISSCRFAKLFFFSLNCL